MIPCSQEMLFHNSQFKIRLRERWRLTNSCTAHAWGDIPWNLNVFKRSTERKNILFHVLSKRQQKAQRWRKDVVQNSEFLAHMFIYEMLLVYINCFRSGQRNRKLEFQFWIKTRCNRKASTAFCEVWRCLIFFYCCFAWILETNQKCLFTPNRKLLTFKRNLLQYLNFFICVTFIWSIIYTLFFWFMKV